MKNFIYITLTTLLLISCGDNKRIKTTQTEPSERILKSYGGKDIAIVLDDMKIDEDKNTIGYQHKYSVLKMVDDSLHQERKDWALVNKDFFEKHKEDLGMEILSSHDGKISRIAQPVGMGWAIGNEAHGEWETVKDSTTQKTRTRWRTSSTSPFFWYWLGSSRIFSRRGYNSYQNHAARGQSYYGNKTGSNAYQYGTRSNYQQNKRPGFFKRKNSNSSSWNRMSRSSSRYSSGTKTRSRSGGFGK